MYYVQTMLKFLNDNGAIILPILLATVVLYGLVNWLFNPYRKQNKTLASCCKSVCAYPDRVSQFVKKLPSDYARQWRIVVNCEVKPSLAFEFVPKRKRCHLLWLFVIAAVVSTTYIAVFFLAGRHFSYLVFQFVFWLAFALITVVNVVVRKRQEKRARAVFARLVAQINRCFPFKTTVAETVAQLQQLNRHAVNDEVVSQASQLLRSRGLEANRSVEDQRRINNALNGLLQAYSRNARVSTK